MYNLFKLMYEFIAIVIGIISSLISIILLLNSHYLMMMFVKSKEAVRYLLKNEFFKEKEINLITISRIADTYCVMFLPSVFVRIF